jgi:molybdopterin-guanine dinucleotide biosynthesis protein A
MPFIDSSAIRYICELQQSGYDAVIPFSGGGQEPLHALYSAKCKDIFENAIHRNERKILDILTQINTRMVSWDEMQGISGSVDSFLNINTPEEYAAISEDQRPVCEPEALKKTCSTARNIQIQVSEVPTQLDD